MEAGSTAAGARAVPSLGAARRRYGEDLIKGLLILATLLSILTTTGIVLALLVPTLEFFGEVGVGEFLTGSKWTPLFEPPSFGVRPLVVGTFLATGIAMAVATPLGLGAAIYLSEYARPRVRKTIKPVLEILAGVPTIVFGYFALTFFTPEILQNLLNVKVNIFNALAAGIVMGFMIVPTVASVAEDAMSAVPQSLREGAYGLGASKLHVSLRVVFPAALSGIVAAIVLGVSRAIGETMIILIAMGQIASNALDPRDPHYSLASFIGATSKGDIATGSIEYKTIFAVGMLLFVLTLIMNLISIRFVRKYRQVYEVSAHGQAVGKAPASLRAKGLAFRLTMFACLGLSILLLGVLLYDVVADGIGHLTWDFLTSFGSIDADKSGAEAAIWGTIWLMAVCTFFIVPVGVATAIYLEEYADNTRWYNRLIEVNIQNLAAVPSIVYGILGLAFLVRGPLDLGQVVLAGGLTLGLLVLPVVIIAGREAIRAVPPSIREGSLALGATQWQTIRRQVLPASIPGVATGVILALSRAIGETAPLIVIGAATVIAFNPEGLDSRFTALPIQIFDWISRASNDTNNYKPLAAAGILLLMILLLLMNSVAIWLRNRYEQKW